MNHEDLDDTDESEPYESDTDTPEKQNEEILVNRNPPKAKPPPPPGEDVTKLLHPFELRASDNGMGVYANKDLPAGVVVGQYIGNEMSLDDFSAGGNCSPYAVKLPHGKVLDASNTASDQSIAHLCNNATGTSKANNAKLAIYTRDDVTKVRIVLTAPVKANQEILCSYGKAHIGYHIKSTTPTTTTAPTTRTTIAGEKGTSTPEPKPKRKRVAPKRAAAGGGGTVTGTRLNVAPDGLCFY